MNNHSVYNKFNSTLSVFNNNSNLNNSVYVSAEKKSKSRTSLNALSFYKSNASVYIKKSDKSDKKENVKTLIRYLGWKNYGGSISPNLFKNPSMTDLINIWNFIFKHVDPLIEVNKDNYGEVVLSFYKDIGYPYTISKSTLVAPTTGLQYNTHLSALAWLCQLLIFEAECFNDINEEKEMNFSDDMNDDSEIKMDEFILHSYKSYINREERNLNDMMNSKLDKEINRLESSINKKNEDITEKKKKIEEIKNHMKENEELIKRNKVLCEENKKIKLLYTNSLEETKKLEKEIEMCKKSYQEEKIKTEKILEEINKVKEILQKQTLNKAQFLQMNENIDKNKEKIEHIKNEIKCLNNEHPNLSEKLNNRNNDLKKLAKNINEKLIEITENINLYKNISISEWNKINNININIDSFTVDNMLNMNWKDRKSDIKIFIEQDEQELKNSLDLIEEHEKQIKIVEEEIEYLKEYIIEQENLVKKLNEDTNNFLNASTNKYNQIVSQNQKMLEEAKEKKNEANEILKEVLASKEEKENELNKIKMENEKVFKEKLMILQKACAILVELKNYSKAYITIVLDEKKKELELYKDLHKSITE
ncbi:kinetochore protein NDC80, putative [Plasmodium relictum]|uniref:Kinetochore protein NDC80 n=1 Tax=Plasmodium relictum TaxID=85471 RepID=A0A1J1H7T0_PLARL|nr:kinetochore protein NDC80, putative [Plasmodium relictum]CRH00971.1 kinetochore protein NDC80, putative [Plasmodium relictum]